jgi:hypothetical protein
VLRDEQRTVKFGLPDVLDSKEHILERDPGLKEILATWASNILSNRGLIAQTRRELDNYQPWAVGLDSDFLQI